jgi:cytochrome c oxidase subunit 3
MGRGESGDDVPSLGSTLRAGIAGSCPSCHRGKLYSGYLTLAPKCGVCGLDYGFADAGDGPAVFVILVTGFVVTGLALITEVRYAPPYWLHAALWGPLAILLPLALLRSFKGALIALQFRHKAEVGKLASK